MINRDQNTPRLERRKHPKGRRLKPGEAQEQVETVINTLKQHIGRWHKIHKYHCRPEYLYRFNKGKDKLDERITLRYAAQVQRGEANFYYGMILSGGIINEPRKGR